MTFLLLKDFPKILISLTWDPETPLVLKNPQMGFRNPMDSQKLHAKLWGVSQPSAHPEGHIFHKILNEVYIPHHVPKTEHYALKD